MRGIAGGARAFGDGDIRLTVWQNLLISGVPDAGVAAAEAAIAGAGLVDQGDRDQGRPGCLHRQRRLPALPSSDTKRHAEEIARWCEARVPLDTPVNIHLTGCPNSCAQHYIGDIGLIGAKVPISEEGDTVEGYHICVGGGFGPDAACGRELYRDVKAEDAPRVVERVLKTYLAHRSSDAETFLSFTRRHEQDALQALFDRNVAGD